jgi:hypothetical protein
MLGFFKNHIPVQRAASDGLSELLARASEVSSRCILAMTHMQMTFIDRQFQR